MLYHLDKIAISYIKDSKNEQFKTVFPSTQHLSFFFFLTGKGKIRVIQPGYVETYPASASKYIVMHPPFERLEYIAETSTDIFKIDICHSLFANLLGVGIYSRQASRFLNTLKKRPGRSQLRPINTNILSCIYRLTNIKTLKSTEKLLYTSIVFKILMFAIQEKNEHTIQLMEAQKIRQTKKILRSNLDTPPKFQQLAAIAGMSLIKFTETFKTMTGLTPYGYLRERRLDRAMDLLMEGELNVTDIAYTVGYKNISYFSKVFFEYYGVKPFQVRQKNRASSFANAKNI